MKLSAFISAVLFSFVLCAAPAPVKILAFAEKDSAVYKTGETIRFKVWTYTEQKKSSRDPDPDPAKMQTVTGEKLDYELTGDGNFKKRGTVITGKDPVIIECSLPRPGFVLLKLTRKTPGEKLPLTRWAGAAVEPEKIVSGTSMPADFEAFWQKRIDEMRARKPVITVKDVTHQLTAREKKLVKLYDVRIADGIINATGLLTVPRYPEKDKLPAIITFGGASWIGARAQVSKAVYCEAIVFHMNIHDTKNHVPTAAEVEKIRMTPEITRYQFRDLLTTAEYRPGKVFLRIVRCLDYLKSRPEWDRKNLIATGPSFGGCQSIVAAALDKDVTLCFPGGAAMCDHLGYRNNQAVGWPQLLMQKEYRKPPETRKKAENISAYFDAANMARLIKCPAVFAVGFIDTTCHPTSVYAAYNNVPHKNKSMIHGTRAAHGSSLKAGEPGAFSAAHNPLYFEAFNGREMLKNRHFSYAVEGAPCGWQKSGKAAVSGDPAKKTTCLDLPSGSSVKQQVTNIRKLSGKAVFAGKIRGSGKAVVRLTGSRKSFTIHAGSGSWQDFKTDMELSPDEYQFFEIRSYGDISVKDLSLKY